MKKKAGYPKQKPWVRGTHAEQKISVVRGLGPRHAENALEGEEIPKLQGGSEAVPGELPTPPDAASTRGGRFFDWLANEVRQGVLSDEDIVEIKRNPYGPAALAAYAQAGIMLSRGAGGKGAGELPRGAVPAEVWHSFKPVGEKAYAGGGAAVRVDPAGNHYEQVGTHVADGKWHAIVQPVEPPGTPPSMEQLRAEAKERLRPDQNMVPLPKLPTPGTPEWEQYLNPFKKPPEEEPPFEPNVPRYRKGKGKVGVAKGYGPTHAENAQEGSEADPSSPKWNEAKFGVDAKLTPREAVLNRNAAELEGRDRIAQLNTEGNKLAAQGVDLAAEGDTDVTDASIRAGKGRSPQRDEEIEAYFDFVRKMEGRSMREGPAALRNKPGPQFDPAMMPIFRDQGERQRSYYPYYGKEDLVLGAQGGEENVGFPRRVPPIPRMSSWGDYFARLAQLDQRPEIEAELADDQRKEQQLNEEARRRYQKWLEQGIRFEKGTSDMKPKKYQQGTSNTDPYAGGPQPPQPQTQPPSPFGTPQYPQQGASFYPQPPQQQQQPVQAQGGLENVEQIGRPQGGYPWQMVPLTGGQLSALQKTMEKEGLNKDQIAGLSQAFKGFGQMGGSGGLAANYAAAGSPTPVYGESGYPSAIPVGGYQGGISDIGYPPFVAPNAVYHKDSGGWQGAYDPNYMIPGYQQGMHDVGGYSAFEQKGLNRELYDPMIGRTLAYAGRGPSTNYGWGGGFGMQPPVGTPGWAQGPTMTPTTFNAQGYPYALPVSGSDAPSLMSRHTPQRRPQ